ncbi:MAG: hypothetical protein ABI681_03870 [Gemmatimonadales bacterium]
MTMRLVTAVAIFLALAPSACAPSMKPGRNSTDAFGPKALSEYTAYSDGGNPWSVAAGSLRGDGVGLQSVLVRNEAVGQNVWVEAVVDSADDGGLVVRFSDKEHYYLLAVRDDEGPFPRGRDNLQIYRRAGPGQAGFTSLWRQDIRWTRGIRHTVRFEAAGDSLMVYLDRERIGAIRDVPTLAGSRIGMRHYGGSPSWISRYRRFRWGPSSVSNRSRSYAVSRVP